MIGKKKSILKFIFKIQKLASGLVPKVQYNDGPFPHIRRLLATGSTPLGPYAGMK